MFRRKCNSEHKENLPFLSNDPHYVLNFSPYNHKKTFAFKPPQLKNSDILTHTLILRKELQLAQLFKYNPSVSNYILNHQFNYQLPFLANEKKFLEKLMGKPIDIRAFEKVGSLQKEKKKNLLRKIEEKVEKKNVKGLFIEKFLIKPKINSEKGIKLPKIERNEKNRRNYDRSWSLPRKKNGEIEIKIQENHNIIQGLERFIIKRGESFEQDVDLEDYLKNKHAN